MMQVRYLGPLVAGVGYPVPLGCELTQFAPSCYLVEVSDEAGVDGPVIEGDCLVVDESRPVQHGDLVVAEIDREYRLFISHRIGGRFRLLPAGGGQGHFAHRSMVRGVVVHRERVEVA